MMRLFDFECQECSHKFEYICIPDESVQCPKCYSDAQKLPPVVNINMGPVGAYGYYDETLDKPITTNKQRREEMRKQEVTPKGDTPKPSGQAWV